MTDDERREMRWKPYEAFAAVIAGTIVGGVVGWLAFSVGYDLATQPRQYVITLPPGTTITVPR